MKTRFPIIVYILCVSGALVAMAGENTAAPSSDWKVERTIPVGGEGGWDYVTAEATNGYIYFPRTTHTTVFDSATGKVVGDITGGKHNHGVAIAPDAGRGFITDGDGGLVTVFDVKTNAVLGTVKAADDADGVVYDPTSKKVFVACGDAAVLVPIAADVKPDGGTADASIDLGGKPESLVTDGQGTVYVDIEDKAEVVAVDAKTMKVTAHWKLENAATPVGLAIDVAHHLLFVGCRSQVMAVVDTQTGKTLTTLPIGKGVDFCLFNPQTNEAFATCGDGTMTVVKESAADKFEVAQTVKTAPGTRSGAIDLKTQTMYLPSADMEPGAGRPRPKAGTFKVLVVSNGAAVEK